MNELSCRTRQWDSVLDWKQLRFEEYFQALKGIRSSLETELRGEGSPWEVHGISERNRHVVIDLIEILHCQEELKKLNQDLQVKANLAIGHRLGLGHELEEKKHQFESLKLQNTHKVLQLEIVCSGKDVFIRLVEEELSKLRATMCEIDAQIASMVELHTTIKQDVLQYQTRSEQSVSDLQWVIKEGILSFVCCFV